MSVCSIHVSLAKSGSVHSIFELKKRHVFNLNCNFSPKFTVHFLFLFFSLSLALTNYQITEAQDNAKYFHANETKTSIMFQQLGLV